MHAIRQTITRLLRGPLFSRATGLLAGGPTDTGDLRNVETKPGGGKQQNPKAPIAGWLGSTEREIIKCAVLRSRPLWDLMMRVGSGQLKSSECHVMKRLILRK